jgi:hypothetical protein
MLGLSVGRGGDAAGRLTMKTIAMLDVAAAVAAVEADES